MELKRKDFNDKELARILRKEYPRTPEHFRETVAAAVREAASGSISVSKGTGAEVSQLGAYGSETARTEASQHKNYDSEATRAEASQHKYYDSEATRAEASQHGYYSSEAARVKVSRSQGSRRRRLLIALPAAALIVLGCGTALASGNFSLQSWLANLGTNQTAAEKYVETEPSVSYGSDANPSQVIDIQEYYFDGIKLVLAAKAADGSGNPYYSKDHASVNDIDCLVNSYENPEDSTEMIYEIYLPEEGLPVDEEETGLTLQMRFYVGDTVQECSFLLQDVDTTAEVRRIPKQRIELENGSVEIYDLTVSLSGISARLHFSFEGALSEELLKRYTFCYVLSDDKGNTADCIYNDSGIDTGVSEIVNQDGVYSCDLTFTVTSLDTSSETLTLTPYLPELDAEGKVIPGTGELLTEKALTISLTSDTPR